MVLCTPAPTCSASQNAYVPGRTSNIPVHRTIGVTHLLITGPSKKMQFTDTTCTPLTCTRYACALPTCACMDCSIIAPQRYEIGIIQAAVACCDKTSFTYRASTPSAVLSPRGSRCHPLAPPPLGGEKMLAVGQWQTKGYLYSFRPVVDV